MERIKDFSRVLLGIFWVIVALFALHTFVGPGYDHKLILLSVGIFYLCFGFWHIYRIKEAFFIPQDIIEGVAAAFIIIQIRMDYGTLAAAYNYWSTVA